MPADHARLLTRLNELSVTDHFDAYGDIAWDDPDFAVDPDDPRWELGPGEPLSATEWYQGLPPGTRSRLGLALVASKMKIGLEFERVLKQGLLEFSASLPNGSPEFRYAYHELIEEAQHSLMFQEFVNRSGFDAAGLPAHLAPGTRLISRLGRWFPPLFFIFVLGGEEPIDHTQRTVLRTAENLHPLLERIMRIHVTEEARHVSFARSHLRERSGGLGLAARLTLGIGTPIILSTMAEMMLKPSGQVVREFSVPPEVIRDAYTRNPTYRAESLASMRRVRRLCEDLGLLGPGYRQIWRALRLLET